METLMKVTSDFVAMIVIQTIHPFLPGLFAFVEIEDDEVKFKVGHRVYKFID